MEQKKNKLLSDMIQNDTDKKMVQLVEAATDLSCGDICTLLEVAHSLPFVGNLEGGDTYINVLTREKESMVIAQYRHPNYDLYKRSIIGEIERREDEPAVYRALEEGISGRGLIGIIDGFFRNYPFLCFPTYLSFASNKRFLQRPYIVRFIIFNRLFVPSTKPLL